MCRAVANWSVCLLVILSVSACSSQSDSAPAPSPEPVASQAVEVVDYATLLTSLQSSGLTVKELRGGVPNPIFDSPARGLNVMGESVQVFEFADSVSADSDAALLSTNGRIMDGKRLSWVGAPHFYKGGSIIVLHVGDTPAVKEGLQTALGPQFAGR